MCYSDRPSYTLPALPEVRPTVVEATDGSWWAYNVTDRTVLARGLGDGHARRSLVVLEEVEEKKTARINPKWQEAIVRWPHNKYLEPEYTWKATGRAIMLTTEHANYLGIRLQDSINRVISDAVVERPFRAATAGSLIEDAQRLHASILDGSKPGIVRNVVGIDFAFNLGQTIGVEIGTDPNHFFGNEGISTRVNNTPLSVLVFGDTVSPPTSDATPVVSKEKLAVTNQFLYDLAHKMSPQRILGELLYNVHENAGHITAATIAECLRSYLASNSARSYHEYRAVLDTAVKEWCAEELDKYTRDLIAILKAPSGYANITNDQAMRLIAELRGTTGIANMPDLADRACRTISWVADAKQLKRPDYLKRGNPFVMANSINTAVESTTPSSAETPPTGGMVNLMTQFSTPSDKGVCDFGYNRETKTRTVSRLSVDQKMSKKDLDERATSFVEAVLAGLESGSVAPLRSDMDTMGQPIQRAMAHQSGMLKSSIRGLAANDSGGAPIAESLSDLRAHMAELDPSNYDFSTSALLRFVPGFMKSRVVTRTQKYFNKFDSAQQVIDSILTSLRNGTERLESDNLTLAEDQDDMRAKLTLLTQQIQLGYLIDEKLTKELDALDEESADRRFIQEELLFPLKQRLMDFQQQVIVAEQGMLALETIIRNNRELIRGSERAANVTTTALTTAVTIAMALSSQKEVLDRVDSLNTTTGHIIEGGSQTLRNQGVAIQTRAASTMLDVEQLERAFQNALAAINEVSDYRLKLLPELTARLDSLSALASEGSEALERMDRGNQAAIADRMEAPTKPPEGPQRPEDIRSIAG